MRKFLITLAILSCCGGAFADPMFRNGAYYIRLQKTACTEAVLQLVPPPVREQFLAAVAQVGGKDFAACWALRPDGMVHVVYEDADQGLIHADKFKDEPGV